MHPFRKPGLPQWLVRCGAGFGRSIRALCVEYITPIAAWHGLREQFKARTEVFESDILALPSSNCELHRPTKRDVGHFVWNEHYWPMMRCIMLWLGIQVAIGLFPDVAKFAYYHWFLHALYRVILVWFIVIDLVMFVVLLRMICASVALYGPTNVAYVLSFRYNPKTAVLYRQVLQSFPRRDDVAATVPLRWEFTRIYLKALARQEAKRRLAQAIVGFLCVVICLSCISLFLSAEGVHCPILKIGNEQVRANAGILPHIYFFLVSFATIGYGDLAFVPGPVGLIGGILTASLVMLLALGLVSYVNYYVVNFKDRLIAGFDGAVGGGTSPDWIWQSLRDV